MLSPGSSQEFDNQRPLLPMLLHFLEQEAVLLGSPFVPIHIGVEMVGPSLSAFGSRSELRGLSPAEELKSDLLPLNFDVEGLFGLDNVLQECALTFGPGGIGSKMKWILMFDFEPNSFRILPQEDLTEEFHIFFGLNKVTLTSCSTWR